MTSSSPYRIEAHTRVKHDLKGLDKKLRQSILEEHLPAIKEDPYNAYPLAHDFKGLWSYHLRFRGSDYRIVYEILPEDKVVLIILIGAREGFYKALARRIGRA